MNFQEINEQLQIAQENFRKAVEREKEAIDNRDRASTQLDMAESAFKKARLDRGLYDREVNSLQEQSRNLRKEADIR